VGTIPRIKVPVEGLGKGVNWYIDFNKNLKSFPIVLPGKTGSDVKETMQGKGILKVCVMHI
jgi:hypothetical protein